MEVIPQEGITGTKVVQTVEVTEVEEDASKVMVDVINLTSSVM